MLHQHHRAVASQPRRQHRNTALQQRYGAPFLHCCTALRRRSKTALQQQCNAPLLYGFTPALLHRFTAVHHNHITHPPTAPVAAAQQRCNTAPTMQHPVAADHRSNNAAPKRPPTINQSVAAPPPNSNEVNEPQPANDTTLLHRCTAAPPHSTNDATPYCCNSPQHQCNTNTPIDDPSPRCCRPPQHYYNHCSITDTIIHYSHYHNYACNDYTNGVLIATARR